MYIKRNLSLDLLLRYSWPILTPALLWAAMVLSAYHLLGWTFLSFSFQPITVIGIAVSFLIGFKNNQSYDRFWEGRKIWGAIVNYSRTWANQVLHLVTNLENSAIAKEELAHHHQVLIHRHIAWLHALRIQLRQPVSFSLKENKLVEQFMDRHRNNELICETIAPYISETEVEEVRHRRNVATHLVKNQGRYLRALRKEGLVNGFDLLMLMKCLEECYNFQGRCERIKNTPFPRQYAFFGKVFTYIFVLLLPLGLLDVFIGSSATASPMPSIDIFLFLIVSVLTTWIFLTWELVGNNSEDPFENRSSDVPMTALTRTIEIDLRDMLDESELPEKLQPKDNILY
ncbi:bestrophin family protein [Tunicatimonas pelagia]|uniref:bestrophin family protein n=1 Tax=Tunicatimonas pelagia TaxID=931531 RepID=UPI002666CDEE|nr:bestrophin family ion channel [Tunicatimonas pelagia]WKN45445.1 bestrophin family ion channel [Tunicatimonas pelagia]